jgi:hypothetical protein
MFPILSISSSSNAAASKIGLANEVAYEKFPELAKDTPGEAATPCKASLHHSYAGRPRRADPKALLLKTQ